MTKPIVFVSLLACLAISSHAATTSLQGEDATYYLALSHPDAVCEIEEAAEPGGRTAICKAGAYVVTATSASGCGDSFGPTYCGSVDPADEPPTANELRCPDGVAYLLVTGSGEARCRREGERKWCESADGADSAEASCARGCESARGAGVCCVSGSSGCPPGIDDDDGV